MRREANIAGALAGAVDASIEAVAIGASTGGPQALFELFAGAGPGLEIPVFITQHLPANFSAVLAQRLGEIAGCDCAEAEDGEPVRRGRIYLAPGDRHMLIGRHRYAAIIRLSDAPPENYCRPAIDAMFRSAATVYSTGLLAVVLSGMGEDGVAGARSVAAYGGRVIVQDSVSSSVWEMPGAVSAAGLAHAALPLAHIRKHFVRAPVPVPAPVPAPVPVPVPCFRVMTPDEFQHLARFLKRRSGIALGPAKRALATSKLKPVAARFGFKSPSGLVRRTRCAGGRRSPAT